MKQNLPPFSSTPEIGHLRWLRDLLATDSVISDHDALNMVAVRPLETNSPLLQQCYSFLQNLMCFLSSFLNPRGCFVSHAIYLSSLTTCIVFILESTRHFLGNLKEHSLNCGGQVEIFFNRKKEFCFPCHKYN